MKDTTDKRHQFWIRSILKLALLSCQKLVHACWGEGTKQKSTNLMIITTWVLPIHTEKWTQTSARQHVSCCRALTLAQRDTCLCVPLCWHKKWLTCPIISSCILQPIHKPWASSLWECFTVFFFFFSLLKFYVSYLQPETSFPSSSITKHSNEESVISLLSWVNLLEI